MTDPWEWWNAETIALACQCPLEHVSEHWPRIVAQLDHCGITTPNVAIGVMGTLLPERIAGRGIGVRTAAVEPHRGVTAKAQDPEARRVVILVEPSVDLSRRLPLSASMLGARAVDVVNRQQARQGFGAAGARGRVSPIRRQGLRLPGSSPPCGLLADLLAIRPAVRPNLVDVGAPPLSLAGQILLLVSEVVSLLSGTLLGVHARLAGAAEAIRRPATSVKVAGGLGLAAARTGPRSIWRSYAAGVVAGQAAIATPSPPLGPVRRHRERTAALAAGKLIGHRSSSLRCHAPGCLQHCGGFSMGLYHG